MTEKILVSSSLTVDSLLYSISFPLWQLTLDINQEVKSQNKMLDGMVSVPLSVNFSYTIAFYSPVLRFSFVRLFFRSLVLLWPPQGSHFGTAAGLFKNTIGKLGTMINASTNSHMYYLVAFVVFIFLVLYFMMGKHSKWMTATMILVSSITDKTVIHYAVVIPHLIV